MVARRDPGRASPLATGAARRDRRDGTTLTYPQLADRVIRLANALEDAGVQSGDRILWLAQNDHGVLEGIIAAALLGAMFCPANWRQTAPRDGLRDRRPGAARSSSGRTRRSAPRCGQRAPSPAITTRAGSRSTIRARAATSTSSPTATRQRGARRRCRPARTDHLHRGVRRPAQRRDAEPDGDRSGRTWR